MAIAYPYWNNDEVISSDKLNSMVQAIINGDPLAVKVSNATKNDVNQIVGYLSSLHDKAKTNLNSATSTNDLDTAYTNMTALVSNKLGAYANDDTVDLYSTGIRASIIAFLQAYDTMMSNDRLNNKNTDNTLGSRIDSETRARENADNAINNKISDMQANGGGRNLLRGTRDFKQWGTSLSKVAVTNGQEKFQAVTGTTNHSQTRFDLICFSAIPLEKDTDYTASFWVKTSEDTDIWSYLFDSGSDDIYADGAVVNHSTTNYTRVVVHFHNGNNTATPSFIPVRINKKSTITVWLYGCMLEKGTVAHDWSPAPEDANIDIKTISSEINNLPTSTNIYSNLPSNWVVGTLSENKPTGAPWTDTFIGDNTNRIRQGNNAYYVTPATGTITISWANSSWKVFMLEYDANKNYIGIQANSVWHTTSPYTVKLTGNTRYIAIALAKTDDSNISPNDLIDSNGNPVVKLKVEQGSMSTPFSLCSQDTQSQIDNLNANKLSSADAKWDLIAKNSSNTYNYASGSNITLPKNSSITIKDDRVIPRIHLPIYFTDYFPNAVSFNNLATFSECDSIFVPSATMATLSNRPTNSDTGSALTGDCFFTNHYAYSGTTIRAFQKIYSCDYNYVFIRSYNGSSNSWTNWSCLTPYA